MELEPAAPHRKMVDRPSRRCFEDRLRITPHHLKAISFNSAVINFCFGHRWLWWCLLSLFIAVCVAAFSGAAALLVMVVTCCFCRCRQVWTQDSGRSVSMSCVCAGHLICSLSICNQFDTLPHIYPTSAPQLTSAQQGEQTISSGYRWWRRRMQRFVLRFWSWVNFSCFKTIHGPFARMALPDVLHLLVFPDFSHACTLWGAGGHGPQRLSEGRGGRLPLSPTMFPQISCMDRTTH